MIKIDRGIMNVNGSKINVMADFTCIVKTMIDDLGFTKDEILDCVSTATKSIDELLEETKANIFDCIEDEDERSKTLAEFEDIAKRIKEEYEE